ncbi:adhesion G-protein coupled receptor G2 [Hoplias malabaricus]|uniref:adhesion G-protein coupled receptor G2 n=1 Tax=Hoplias malabaricus TaxID=27720 RepID=UPI0034622359
MTSLTIVSSNTTTGSETTHQTNTTIVSVTTYNITGSEITDQTNTSIPSATIYNTTVPTIITCNFSQNCSDQSVYYWMMISVEVTGNMSEESNITEWLETLFQRHLGRCSSSIIAASATPSQVPFTLSTQTSALSTDSQTTSSETTFSANSTSVPYMQNFSSLTTVQIQNWTSGNSSVKENETTTSLFQNIEVMCDNKTAIRQTVCSALLKLSQPASSCCISSVISIEQINSTIKGQVIGNKVERVAKGFCHNNGIAPPIGSFEICNGSLSFEVPCNPNVTSVNVSCGTTENVYASLGIHDQMNCSSEKPTNYCYCSAYCNSTDAYYSLNIIPGTSTVDQLKSSLQLMLINPICNVTDSGCKLLHNISAVYENSTVQCASSVSPQSCNLIVKLKFAVNICSVSSALMTALQYQNGVQISGPLTRAAICSWDNIPNLARLQPDIQVSLNISPIKFCKVPDLDNLLNYCKVGTDLAVLLDETCISNVVTAPPISQSSSTATTMMATVTTNTTVTFPDNTTTLQPTLVNSVVNVTAFTTITNTLNTTPPVVLATSTTTNPTITSVTVNTAVSTTLSASAEKTAEGLLNLSMNVSALNSTQVEQLVSQLEALLSGPNVSLALGNTSINIVSNLLDAPAKTLVSTSNRIIGIVDTVGLKLVVKMQSQSILSTSVALAVEKVDGTNFQQTSFTMTDPFNLQIGGGSRTSRSIKATLLPPQGSIILPSSLLNNLNLQQQQLASRVQFNFYQKNTLFQDSALNANGTRLASGILSSSVTNMTISNLRDNVTITLRNTEAVSANLSLSCVFWNFSLNGGSGGWSSEGCSVLNSTVNETVCICNHLTSFGVLLDISRQVVMSPLQATILTYITYIGCGISAIFLSITLLTYLAFEKLRKDIPSKILIQLCLALLLLNLVFLLDSWLALYPNAVGLCISTAFFLHYFLLASFTWMALEAVHMYLALVKVFNTYISRFMLKLGLAGWGIPLVVVIIVIAIDKNNYGLVSYGKFEDGATDGFCWLKNNIAFYVAVVAYFCVVFMLNFSMFIVVMVQLCRIKRQNPHNLQHRSGLQDLRSVAGLTVLLGLTWGFAFFAWGPVNLAFMYLFAIFNSLQGFFIFVFHCAVKENVRRQWRIYLCCGKFRLAENSDWSHTATQKTKKSSVNRVGSSSVRSSNSNNSSSSTTFLGSNSSRSGSDRSLGISSPFDDRVITAQEESSPDVVQNEINHRYRSQRSY